jgi:hypothetical protein
MGVWESYSIERNFDELVEEIQKVKRWTLNEIKKLEDSTNLKKIQQLKDTYLSKTQVSLREDSSWYSKNKYILLSVPEEFYNNLEDKSLISQFVSNNGWGTTYFKIYIREDNEDKLAEFKQILDVIYQADQKTHKENLKIVEDNKKIERAIFDILDKVGIKRKYYGYKTSRSTKKTELYYHFPSEISNQIPTYYSEDSLDKRKKELLTQINLYWSQEIDKIKQERLKKEQEQKEKEKNRKLALLLAKYDLSLDCDWHDVLEVILDKNKYLRLAHYLEKNRGDWSNGCDYAETGLDEFEVENELDQKIYDDIRHYIDNWIDYMDGRVFRDCEYNYSVLYRIAEEQDASLVSDYYEVMKYIDEY